MTTAAKPPTPPPPLCQFKGTVVGVNITGTPVGHPDVEVTVHGTGPVAADTTRVCWRADPALAPKVGATVAVTIEAVP